MQQNIHGGDIYSRQIRLDFSVNGNPLGMPDAAVQAIHEAVQHVGEYPDITAAAMTEAVSRMLSGECGREIPKEYLLFGNGASELFLAVVHALKPRNIVIPVPSFYGYEYVAEAAGSYIKYVYLPEETGFRPGRELLQELTADTDMLFVANPNNPTGQLMGREYLQELLEHCRQQGITVVVDECFIEFCESGREQPKFLLGEIGQYEKLCYARGASGLSGMQQRRASGENTQAATGMEPVGVCPESGHRLRGAVRAISARHSGICEKRERIFVGRTGKAWHPGGVRRSGFPVAVYHTAHL